MSEQALRELQEARARALLSQRTCSWCQQKFETAYQLADHIMEEHEVR
jgi:hypothetical protein